MELEEGHTTPMGVRFRGTRGSIPASLTAENVWEKVRHALEIAKAKKLSAGTDIETFMEEQLPFWAKATYGTNTPCIEIRDGERFLNDPATNDKDLDKRLKDTEELVPLVTEGGRLKVSIAWDGRVIAV
jgi:hypothetical protein